MMDKNEQNGQAHNNPYAQAVYRRWLLTLRDFIERDLESTGKAGRRGAHVALLKPLDPAAVAYIAVRGVLAFLLHGNSDHKARAMGRQIGQEVFGELVLATFEHVSPELFWEISNDLDRRHSKSSRHRLAAMRNSAATAEVELPSWSPGDKEQVGLYLIEALRSLGMVTIDRHTVPGFGRKKPTVEFKVFLSVDALATVEKIRDVVELTMPFHLPFIEQPRDWVSLSDGGYHTDAMRRNVPFCVNLNRSTRKSLEEFKQADMGKVLRAINKLQATRWQVNKAMLNTVRDLARRDFDMDEVITQAELPKPPKPEWLVEGLEKDQMDAEQLEEFSRWKRLMAEWHTQRELRGTRWGRFYTATRIATKFEDYEAIHFLYQADFRGRLYAITTGISPQGSDLQKSLLRFADGKPLDTEDAVRWFKINGANRFGVDKVPFEDRIKWVEDNDRFIIEYGSDPVGHTGWAEADAPLQFLAWCVEYAEWRRAPQTFVSRIPVGLDGSCNGLQHFSAMLRDSVGGRATNLVPGSRPNDIYQQVADVVQRKLTDLKTDQLSERDLVYRDKWLAHGMNRSLVKRSVMTLPYGSTRFSCAEFITEDYLKHGKALEFEKKEYPGASNFLSHLVWDSIGEVVIAASAAMSWLQKCASTLIKSGHSQIRWTAPSGFPVIQVYNEVEIMHVRSLLMGGVRITMGSTGDDPAINKHKNGVAPNFVHSMDAAHLTLTVLDCDDAGIDSLAMIHDDYGTHAADAHKLFNLIRSRFVEIYETSNPLAEFSNQYDGLPPIPPHGELDIREVLVSPYFFA